MRATLPAAVGLGLVAAFLAVWPCSGQETAPPAAEGRAVGTRGHVGHLFNPKKVQRLKITKPGVYENYLVDGQFVKNNLVKINADNVTLRNCLIRNGGHNGVTVYGKNVVIENCLIHHMLAGTFETQRDAHGITGRPTNLIIRNCGIYYTSGDSLQFDPDRLPWSGVLVDNCTLATGKLPLDAAGFKRGEIPGENAVDTKLYETYPRATFTMRNCLMYGWGGGQIVNGSALNLKEHIEAVIIGCVLLDNDIAFRLRGDNDNRGGAHVTIRDCAVYRSNIAVRMEDAVDVLRIINLGIGDGVGRAFATAQGGPRDFSNVGQFVPPSLEESIQKGVAAAAAEAAASQPRQ